MFIRWFGHAARREEKELTVFVVGTETLWLSFELALDRRSWAADGMP